LSRNCSCGSRVVFVFSSQTAFTMVVDLFNYVEALHRLCFVLCFFSRVFGFRIKSSDCVFSVLL
jgi:hypothetical protein